MKQYTYYFISAIAEDGSIAELYGSYLKSDCTYEKEAEKEAWKAEGYMRIGLSSKLTTEAPSKEVYPELY